MCILCLGYFCVIVLAYISNALLFNTNHDIYLILLHSPWMPLPFDFRKSHLSRLKDSLLLRRILDLRIRWLIDLEFWLSIDTFGMLIYLYGFSLVQALYFSCWFLVWNYCTLRSDFLLFLILIVINSARGAAFCTINDLLASY